MSKLSDADIERIAKRVAEIVPAKTIVIPTSLRPVWPTIWPYAPSPYPYPSYPPVWSGVSTVTQTGTLRNASV